MIRQEHETTEPEGVDVYAPLAAEVLGRHDQGDSEADIRSAVRDFIIQSGLVTASEVTQGESPTQAAPGRVDLVTQDAFFEFKRNLYSGTQIAPEYIRQLDDLPVKRGEFVIPADDNSPGGIGLGGMERRMRERWQTVSRMWDDNKAQANKLTALGRLNYNGGLSEQLAWQQDSRNRPVRILYPKAGQLTAAILTDDRAIVDYTTYWATC